MSEPEQSVEAPVKTKKPMDETRLSQLAAARELAVKARKDKAMLKQKEKNAGGGRGGGQGPGGGCEVEKVEKDQGGLFIRV